MSNLFPQPKGQAKIILQDLSQVTATWLGQLRMYLEANPFIIPWAAVQGAPPVVTGRVNADGSIAAGSGFSVSGSYTITFQNQFSTLPTVVATPAQDSALMAVLSSLTANSVTIHFYDNTGASQTCPFTFVARPTL